jgi:hypothetical protein
MTMPRYEQAACGFFLGFLPVFIVAGLACLTRKKRKRKALSSDLVRPSSVPGIPVNPDTGDPVTPTIVLTRNYREYVTFCFACRMKETSRNLLSVYLDSNYPTPPLEANIENAKWKHVAFIGIDPRRQTAYSLTFAPAWVNLERLRTGGYLERAFYYPEAVSAKPNYADNGREW